MFDWAPVYTPALNTRAQTDKDEHVGLGSSSGGCTSRVGSCKLPAISVRSAGGATILFGDNALGCVVTNAEIGCAEDKELPGCAAATDFGAAGVHAYPQPSTSSALDKT